MSATELVVAPTVESARSAYLQAWYGFCLGSTREQRCEQLMIMAALKPFCALVKNGRDWRKFIETIPGYNSYLERRRNEGEELEEG